ncbi:MAG: VOC family protein [Woeseiaceae bacterium]
MKSIRTTLFLAIAVTFGCLVANQSAQAQEEESRARVTGIGGVFLLSKGDGKELSSWYEKHLGMRPEDFGAVVLQWEEDTAEDNGLTVWGVANHDSKWFSPSESVFMINYRVDDLELMIEQLIAAGIDILQGPEYHENGVFAWIMDPDGNKIELWEPKLWDDKNRKRR